MTKEKFISRLGQIHSYLDKNFDVYGYRSRRIFFADPYKDPVIDDLSETGAIELIDDKLYFYDEEMSITPEDVDQIWVSDLNIEYFRNLEEIFEKPCDSIMIDTDEYDHPIVVLQIPSNYFIISVLNDRFFSKEKLSPKLSTYAFRRMLTRDYIIKGIDDMPARFDDRPTQRTVTITLIHYDWKCEEVKVIFKSEEYYSLIKLCRSIYRSKIVEPAYYRRSFAWQYPALNPVYDLTEDERRALDMDLDVLELQLLAMYNYKE